jgi:hydrogenase maturation protease
MRILIAGIGNIFLGDDGFGVEVVRRLREQPMDGGVEVADFGIRGVHLAYELASGTYDAAILVDAVHRDGEPGTLYVIEPTREAAEPGTDAIDAHSLTPDTVLAWLARLGSQPERLLVVGCEPEAIEESIGLSAPVEAAIDRAVALTREVAAQLAGVAPCV